MYKIISLVIIIFFVSSCKTLAPTILDQAAPEELIVTAGPFSRVNEESIYSSDTYDIDTTRKQIEFADRSFSVNVKTKEEISRGEIRIMPLVTSTAFFTNNNWVTAHGLVSSNIIGIYDGSGGWKRTSEPIRKVSGIKIMSREFLEPNTIESRIYGYYSYLIFTEKSESTYELRKAATKSFMCLFQDVGRANEIGIDTKNMAVFYAPVNSGTDTNALKRTESFIALLESYNYAFAQALISKLSQKRNLDNFKVGIVTYPMPLRIQDSDFISLENLDILDLSSIPPAQAGAVIQKLRQAVLSVERLKEIQIPILTTSSADKTSNMRTVTVPSIDYVSREDFATKFRMILASLGKMILFTESAEAASFTCK